MNAEESKQAEENGASASDGFEIAPMPPKIKPVAAALIGIRLLALSLVVQAIAWLPHAAWQWGTLLQYPEETELFGPVYRLSTLLPVVTPAVTGLALWFAAAPLARLMTRPVSPTHESPTQESMTQESATQKAHSDSSPDGWIWQKIAFSLLGLGMAMWAVSWGIAEIPAVLEARSAGRTLSLYERGRLLSAAALLAMALLLFFGSGSIQKGWKKARAFR